MLNNWIFKCVIPFLLLFINFIWWASYKEIHPWIFPFKTKNVTHVKRTLALNDSQMTVVFLPDSLSLIYPIALLQQNRSDPKAV